MKAFAQLLKTLESMGAVLKNISLPHTQYAVAVYYIVAVAEASSNLGSLRWVSVMEKERKQTR
jgi:Asp-tRNA(Asn)/Glu-tRNA(Gln) amidotransferase A subunit family amidase